MASQMEMEYARGLLTQYATVLLIPYEMAWHLVTAYAMA
jgi:hypothetical protein